LRVLKIVLRPENKPSQKWVLKKAVIAQEGVEAFAHGKIVSTDTLAKVVLHLTLMKETDLPITLVLLILGVVMLVGLVKMMV
jgi:hypothetical protein